MNRFVALARTGLLGFAAASLVISTGCGIDVGVGGTTGTGGGHDGSGGSCSGPGATTTVGSGGQPGTTTSSTGTGSSGVACGGLTPFPTSCPADEFCDYDIKNCGAFDNQGVCTKRPMACDKNLHPTCGCDGQVYDNECAANAAGVSANNNGCMPPAGQFACGAHFCDSATSYCEHEISDVAGFPDGYICKPLPAGCGLTPTCACLSGVACGNMCSENSNGDLTVICPGG